LGLAREQRLVDLQAGGGAHDAIGDDLVAEPQRDQLVEHDLLDRDVAFGGIADDESAGGIQHGEPVEHALGADLLDDPDQRVADEHDPEERILRLPRGEDGDEQRAEDRVEAREEVGAQDLAERAARALAARVGLAERDALGDLGSGQSCVRSLHDGRSMSPGARADAGAGGRARGRHRLTM
jgi:hypothetical protein